MAGKTSPSCNRCSSQRTYGSRGEIIRIYTRAPGGKGQKAIGWMCVATCHIRLELTPEEALERPRYGSHRHLLLDQGPSTELNEHYCSDMRTVSTEGPGPTKTLASGPR